MVWQVFNTTRKPGIHHLYLFFALLWGTIQVLIMPPFQVPDESAHFLRAWGVSDFQFINYDLNIQVPKNVLLLIWEISPDDVRKGKSCLEKLLTHFNDIIGPKDSVTGVNFCAYNPIGYIPSAIGISMAIKLNLSPLHAFYLGRFFNLLTGILLIFYAIKHSPFGKEIFLFTALFPMSIHQLASLSNDSLTLSGLIFFTSQILYFSQRSKLNIKVLVYLLMLSISFVQVKPGYIAFLLLFLILSANQFSSRKEYLSFLFLIIICNLLVFYLLSNIADLEKFIKNIPQIRPKEQIDYIIKNPFEYVIIFTKTLLRHPWHDLKSMLGILGWLELIFPNKYYLFIIIALLVTLVFTDEDVNLKYYQRIIFFSVFFMSLFIIFTLQYIFWTEPCARRIEGFQGRYILSAFPLLILSIYKIKSLPIKFSKNGIITGLFLVLVFLIIATTSTINIYNHYYNYYNNECLDKRE